MCTISPAVMTDLGIVQAPCKTYVIARGIGVHVGGCDWPACKRAHILHVAARLTARRRDSRHRNRRMRRRQPSHPDHDTDGSCKNDGLKDGQGDEGRGGVCASISDEEVHNSDTETGVLDDVWRASECESNILNSSRAVETGRDSNVLYDRLRDIEIENSVLCRQLRETQEVLAREQEENCRLNRALNNNIIEIDETRWLNDRLNDAITEFQSVIEETRRENYFLHNSLLDIEKERRWSNDGVRYTTAIPTDRPLLSGGWVESRGTETRVEFQTRCPYPIPDMHCT